MDFGFAAFLEKFEDRFGKKATTSLLFLLGITVAITCFSLIINQAVIPIANIVSEIMPFSDNGGMLFGVFVKYGTAIISTLLGFMLPQKLLNLGWQKN